MWRVLSSQLGRGRLAGQAVRPGALSDSQHEQRRPRRPHTQLGSERTSPSCWKRHEGTGPIDRHRVLCHRGVGCCVDPARGGWLWWAVALARTSSINMDANPTPASKTSSNLAPTRSRSFKRRQSRKAAAERKQATKAAFEASDLTKALCNAALTAKAAYEAAYEAAELRGGAELEHRPVAS